MPSIFNIARIVVYATVLAWTLIVLGLAAHFESVLIANEYTHFIPLAIFTSVITFIVIPILLVSGWIKRYTPTSQVRWELGLLFFIGIFWFALGIYTVSSEETDVECDVDGDGTFEESDDFSTDDWQAQSRVLQAFSLFNAILLLGFFFFLLVLSLREHLKSRPAVWISKTTTYPWFGAAPLTPPKGSPASSASASVMSLPFPATLMPKSSPPKNGGEREGKTLSGSPMKAGGHYIIYIPPPVTASNVRTGG